jgi:opacity protein-like surface antigen
MAQFAKLQAARYFGRLAPVKFKIIYFLSALLLSGLAVSSLARATEFEITPFAGNTWGGEFKDATTGKSLSFDERSNFGIMLDFKQANAKDSWIEVYYSRQQTNLRLDQGMFLGTPLINVDVEYYHIGGTYGTESGMVRPFVVGTIGATRMVPQEEGLHSETRLSLGLGGGVKLYMTNNLGVRLDARWFGTLFNSNSEVFCSNGLCTFKVEGDYFSQYVVNAGLVLAF